MKKPICYVSQNFFIQIFSISKLHSGTGPKIVSSYNTRKQSMLSNYLEFIQNKLITFPNNEHKDIKDRLLKNLPVHSIRVDKEYNKYRPGQIYKTQFGIPIKITKVNKLTNINQYIFFKHLTTAQKNYLKRFNKIDHIIMTKN